MALKIRLARGGAKKRPFYRIVVAEASSPRDGRFVEKVGTYNPLLPRDHAERIVLNMERIKHWLSVGAQPTDRVELFLGNAGLVEKKERSADPKKSAPKKRAQERLKAEQEALAAAKPEPVVEAAPAPAPVEEVVAVEAPVIQEAAVAEPEAVVEAVAVEAPVAEETPVAEPEVAAETPAPEVKEPA